MSNLNYIKKDQFMGNICAKPHDPEPSRSKKKMKHERINSCFNQTQADKVNEIREFLTLTAHNTLPLQNIQASMKLSNKSYKPKVITDFKVVRGLGRGAFGQVYMVRDMNEQKLYAMKIIMKETIKSPEDRLNTISERFILEAVNHPFIVKLHYAFQSQRKLYLLCDLMSGGELFYLLRRNRKFPEEVAKFYAAEILLALEYLHSRNIIYRDLKPQNILLDASGHIKLTDFGLSKVCVSDRQVTYSVCGTPQYIAPQVIRGKGYTQTADWFSFGSLIYDMLTGRPPFYSANKNQIIKNITTRSVPIPQTLSPQARSLLKGLFTIKPKQRLGWLKDGEQIKAHPFFASVNFQQIYNKQVDAPISFKESLNQQGFEIDFQGSYRSTVNLDGSVMTKGLIFDGFTYYKPQISPNNKPSEFSCTFSVKEIKSENGEKDHNQNVQSNQSPEKEDMKSSEKSGPLQQKLQEQKEQNQLILQLQ